MEISKQEIRDTYIALAESSGFRYLEEQADTMSVRIYTDQDGNDNFIFVDKDGRTISNDALYNMYNEAFGGSGNLYANRMAKWEERKKILTEQCTLLTVVSFLAIRTLNTGILRNRASMKLMSSFLGWLDNDL